MMVQMWHSILKPYIDDAEQLQYISLNVQRVCYGFVSQTLLVEPEFIEWIMLERDILQSLEKINSK
jgi:hypothetical protein